MARIKLRCIVGSPGLKSSYREKGLLEEELVAIDFEFDLIDFEFDSLLII